MLYKLTLHETPPPITDEQIRAYIAKQSDSELLSNSKIAEIVAKVRSEEKGKLYGNLDTMKRDIERLTAVAADAEETKKKAIEEANRKARENMTFEQRMQEQAADFNRQLQQVESRANERVAQVQTEFSQFQISNMRTNQALRGGLPEGFHKFVTGNTPEEIASSVQQLQNEIKAITPAPTTPPTVLPGTQPNNPVPPQPPTNNGTFDPATAAQIKSPTEISVKDYVNDDEKRAQARLAAEQIFKQSLTTPS